MNAAPEDIHKGESLLVCTRRMLNEVVVELNLREIAEGSGVGYEWLRKFYYGVIKRPGVDLVETLYTYLRDYQAAARLRGRGAPLRRVAAP